MTITKTFASTFYYMMLSKLRRFIRRSLYQYAIGIAVFTYGMHGQDATMSLGDMVGKGLFYFAITCVFALLLNMLVAAIQLRQIPSQTITFAKTGLQVEQDGETSKQGWDWIISAEETASYIALVVKKMPRFELYLSKAKLNETEYQALHEWLVGQNKLPTTNT